MGRKESNQTKQMDQRKSEIYIKYPNGVFINRISELMKITILNKLEINWISNIHGIKRISNIHEIYRISNINAIKGFQIFMKYIGFHVINRIANIYEYY